MPHAQLIVGPLNGGLLFNLPTNRLPDPFSPRMRSVRIRDSILSQRPGLVDFNGNTGLAQVTSTIVSIFEYRRETGVVETVVVTGGPIVEARKIYRSSGGAWADITDPALFDTVSPDIQGGVFEPYDAAVAKIPTQNDVLYMSNGHNVSGETEIIKWTGSGNAISFQGATGPARTLASFANRLVLGNVYDGTETRGSRVEWSADGDAETWSGGGSGSTDLTDTADSITRMVVLRGQLAIYKERSIFLARETGLFTVPLGFVLVSKDIGAVAGGSVAAAGDRHFFLGQDNVYEFDGAQVRTIGDPIRRDLRDINQARLRQIFAIVDEVQSEYWLFVPEANADHPTSAWVYNYQERHWTRWEFPTLTAISRAATASAQTWAQAQTAGTLWSDVGFTTWAQQSVSGRPTIIAGRTDRTTDEVTVGSINDGSTAIDASWESRDIDFAGQPGAEDNKPISTADLKLLTRIRVRYRGTGQSINLLCEVSTDGGLSFVSTSPTPGTAQSDGGVLFFNTWLTADRFRIRLRNNTAGQSFPGIEELTLSYIPRDESR